MKPRQSQRDRRDRVIDELLRMDTDTACDLALRVSKCGKAWGGRFRCKQPICDPCRRTYQRQQARALKAECAGMGNDDLVFASIVACGTDTVDGIDPIVAALKRGTRNRLDALRREDMDLWGSTALTAWIEIDAMAPSDLPLLGSSRRALLPQIAPIRLDSNDPLWVITAHGLMAPGNASRAEVSQALSKQWPIAGQVDVRPLYPAKTVEENIEAIVSYSAKFACTTTLGTVKEPWPHAWQAEIFAKLAEKRNAFEYCKFGIGPATVLPSSRYVSVTSEQMFDPMTFTYSSISFPMSNITGVYSK